MHYFLVLLKDENQLGLLFYPFLFFSKIVLIKIRYPTKQKTINQIFKDKYLCIKLYLMSKINNANVLK